MDGSIQLGSRLLCYGFKMDQVLQKALEVWDLQVIPLHSPVAEPAQVDPELENAFICHLQDHWFCIRKVNGEWYNFDSLYAAPQNLSKFYLSAYLDSLKASGWSIFLVRGNFPKECPMTSGEATNGYGQWLLPKMLTLRENAGEVGTSGNDQDDDLEAAIAASLSDSSPVVVNKDTNATTPPPVAALSDDTPPVAPATSGGEDGALENESKMSSLQDK
ncbi:hypothetical protein E3N88_42549 [Mikania micrantha]|uniref:ubiquitinyl hydrolase 1 n=1 Tax=Mikania micrantha TaxID=192012 RepID=A0A5N6LHI6_9ASTR|nr:hypothetical protein E3N88_42549 [Mikania micrantha]